MKKIIVSLLSFLSISSNTQANVDTFVYGVRGYYDQAKSYSQTQAGKRFIQDKTMEFDNTNTFVKLNPLSKMENRPTFKNVEILVPRQINYNTFMEILFKSFAAKSVLGINRTLMVDSNENILELGGVDLPMKSAFMDQLLSISGITKVCSMQLDCREIKPKYSNLAIIKKPKESILYSFHHESLTNEIAMLTNQTKVNNLLEYLANFQGEEYPAIFIVLGLENPVNKTLLEILSFIYEIKNKYDVHIHLISPYLPYARSDKSEEEFGVATQGRLIADLLQGSFVDAITVVRPHAPQSMGFFTIPNFQISGHKTINAYLGRSDVKVEHIISPDAGFQKDATKYAQDLGIDVTTFNKRRDSDGVSNIINNTGVGHNKYKHIAIIDDETATGGTLSMVAADILQEFPTLKITAVVTHLAGPAQKALQSPHLHEMVITNTLPIDSKLINSGKIKILSIAPELSLHINQLLEVL